MAEVLFPSTAPIASMSIEPWYPGQVAHASPFTGSVQVLNRGYASWRGSAEIALTDEDGDAQAIEAFFASLAGQGNWCPLPLNRPTLASDASATVTAVQTDGTISHVLSASMGAKVGDWVSSGSRVYSVRGVGVGGDQVVLDPQIPLGIGDEIERATTIRARASSGRQRAMRRTPDFWGPWLFQWEEAF